MSDFIKREDAIMALRLEYPMMPLFKSLREEWAIKTEGYRKAEEVIMKLPSVDAPTTMTGVIDAIREAEYRGYMKAVEDIPQGEWIPCSERLPKRQGYYICTCKDGAKYKRTTAVKWSNGWQLTGARAYWVVLAWMPLPEPWKGADDE